MTKRKGEIIIQAGFGDDFGVADSVVKEEKEEEIGVRPNKGEEGGPSFGTRTFWGRRRWTVSGIEESQPRGDRD